MKRLLVCVLLTVAVPVTSVAVDAGPAFGCLCLSMSDARAFEAADAVFVGKLVEVEAPARGPVTSSIDPALWTFKVREVYKGNVARRQVVASALSGVSCGISIPEQGTFLVFADKEGSPGFGPVPARGQLFAHLCGGTRDVTTRPLEPGLAAPHPPPRKDR